MKVYIKVAITVSDDGRYCNHCPYGSGHECFAFSAGKPLKQEFVKGKPKTVRSAACKRAEVRKA
jgi:hypothetical protein